MLLKIASHVDFSMPVHLVRSDCMHNFDETYSENPCGVRMPLHMRYEDTPLLSFGGDAWLEFGS